MLNADVISMPDKWEYPWYAAWDLAFHYSGSVAGRFRFRKRPAPAHAAQSLFPPQRADPAYEWNFSDVNPPVHAWATVYLYKMERMLGGRDMRFLETFFPGLDAELQLVGQP